MDIWVLVTHTHTHTYAHTHTDFFQYIQQSWFPCDYPSCCLVRYEAGQSCHHVHLTDTSDLQCDLPGLAQMIYYNIQKKKYHEVTRSVKPDHNYDYPHYLIITFIT